MAGGQSPKPAVLKDLHGSTEPRNPNEPVPDRDLGPDDCPEHFNEELRAIWLRTLENAPRTLLKNIDGDHLASYVLAVWMHKVATIKLLAMNEEFTLKSPQGYPMPSPYVTMINRQALLISRLAVEMGFTPVSRTRIHLISTGAASPIPPGKPGPKVKPKYGGSAQSIESYLHEIETEAETAH